MILFEWDQSENLSNIWRKLLMKDEYNFSKGIKNPYAKQLKKQITINISNEVLLYFKKLAEETGIPYQNLINLYLVDCVKNKKVLNLEFK